MPAEVKKEIQLEIAHVLFIDVVGYSKFSINEQGVVVDELTKVVRSSDQYQKAEAAGRLIKIPTGDGMGLVFHTSPEAPAQCAVEIGRALREHPRLQLRMGVHSGPVSGVIDVNERANVAGAGLNIAQRVMDCGDAGHILLSKHVAEDLEEYEQWRPLLHDLGTCEVKHGVRLSVVNLYDDRFGNATLPRKFETLRKRRTRLRWAAMTIALLALAAIVAGIVMFSRNRVRSMLAAPEKSIAVLPFENLSEEKANAYFADGIQNEILTRLASVRDLKVISRTSTAKYQSKPDNLKTVAQELGVSPILEGAVQRAANQVRVNVQLIEAATDAHLWAKSYDRDCKDVLGVQSAIAEEIAEALKANLSPSESHVLAAIRTQNTEAYDLFLRAQYEFHQAQSTLVADAFDRADAFYQQALARDSNFAEAAAGLAYSRLMRHWFVSPLSPRELEEVKSIIDHALAVAPNSAEAHVARGVFFYWAHRQYDDAVAEFNRALALQPNNALAQQFLGWVNRRRGEWERSIADAQRAQELDPRDPSIPSSLGGIYAALRLWNDAERVELRTL